jgi:hypothetical protein
LPYEAEMHWRQYKMVGIRNLERLRDSSKWEMPAQGEWDYLT